MQGVWRFLVGVASLHFIVFSALGLKNALAEADWTTFAERLDRTASRAPPPDEIRDAVLARLDGGPRSCDDGADRSQVALALYHLRLSYRRGGEVEARPRALATAVRELRTSLACHPREGGLWATLATVEALGGAGDDRLRSLLSASISEAPFEEHALSIRAALFAKSLSRPAFREEAGFAADLANAVRLLRPSDAAPILATLVASGSRDLAEEILAGLPPEQRQRLADLEVKDPSQRDDGWDRFRHFDFDPFAKVAPAP